MREQWTLPEGIEKLFPAKADSEIDDLSTDERHLILDVSFAEGSDDGVEGLSIILTGSYEPIEEDGEPNLMFSAFVPANTKELPELVKRIATGLGIKLDERIWESGDI